MPRRPGNQMNFEEGEPRDFGLQPMGPPAHWKQRRSVI